MVRNIWKLTKRLKAELVLSKPVNEQVTSCFLLMHTIASTWLHKWLKYLSLDIICDSKLRFFPENHLPFGTESMFSKKVEVSVSIHCMHVCTLECVGISKLITTSTCGMSRPLLATSVAIRIERSLDLNLFRAPSLFDWK